MEHHLVAIITRLLVLSAMPNVGTQLGPGTEPAPPIAFRNVAAESGVRFRFDNGSRGRRDLPEIMGGGVALIDIDGDGFLDLFLCNGGPIVPNRVGPTPLAASIGPSATGDSKMSPASQTPRVRLMRWVRR